MTSPDYAALAARLLRRTRATLHPRGRPSDEELTRALETALTNKRQRRRRRRAMAPLAAAVLGGLLWAAVRHRPPEPVAVPTETPRPFMMVVGPLPADAAVIGAGRRRTLASGAAIGRGDHVVARAALALHLATGTRLRLRGELDVLEAGEVQRFDLRAGSLDAEVAKLRQSERFLVRAGRAELEVWGTAFVVSLAGACEGRPVTTLDVREGVVAVRADGDERLVRAGEQWRSPCSTAAAAPPVRHQRTARVVPAAAERASTLARENAMFFAAMRARQDGDEAAALRLLGQLLAQNPSGPLSEAALAERMRLLRGRDATAARAVARDYLRRFPGGFAREEARTLAEGR